MKAYLKNKNSHGFTLIELLVSMVITTIIISILVTVTVASLNVWNRNREELRASLQGKVMLESMAADFESMVVRRSNDYQWLYAKFATPSEGPNSNLSPCAQDLIFFSAATDRYNGQIGVPDVDLGGDVSAVGYQLVYKDPISDLDQDKYKTFALYRKLIDPKQTFTSLLGKDNLKVAFDVIAPPGDDGIDANQNFVCENVYQFTVKFHVDVTIPDPSDSTKTVTTNVAVSLNDSEEFILTGNGLTCPPTSQYGSDVLANGRLTAVEVSLTVLTDSAIRQLRARNFSNDEKLSDFIAENSYQYSKLIPVPSY